MSENDEVWLEEKKKLENIREECKKLALEKNADGIFRNLCDQFRATQECSRGWSYWQVAKIFVPYLRLVLCPHLKEIHKISSIRKWDLHYASVLVHCIFPSNFEITWVRICKSILAHDLNRTQPYNGSSENCHVNIILKFVREVTMNDFIGLQRKLSTRLLKYSFYNLVIDIMSSMLCSEELNYFPQKSSMLIA